MERILDYIPGITPAMGFFGALGAMISTMYGGWSMGMTVLVIAMGVDYFSGLVVAGIFHASPKTESGALESRAGWKGLCRKGMTLLIVLIAALLDDVIGTTFIRDAVVFAYLANEVISIIENAGLMGVPIPEALTKAIEILKDMAEVDEHEDH